MQKIFFYIAATRFRINVFSKKSFKIMKSNTFLVLLFVIIANFSTLIAHAQKEHRMKEMFYSDSTAILIENNFIRDLNNVQYQPYDIKIPFQDFYFDVYGSRLVISVYHFAELMKNGGFTIAGSFRDSSKQDAYLFNLKNLQFKVTKNGILETDWTLVTANPFIDTFNYKYNNKKKNRKKLGKAQD